MADLLGATVAMSSTESGGFSGGVAARVGCTDGRRAFVKAVPIEDDAGAVALYRREAVMAAALPSHLPAPRLLGCVEADGWLGLAFEEIDGHCVALPWRDAELRLVSAAVDELSGLGTPCPVAAAEPWGGAPDGWESWRSIAVDPGAVTLPTWCRGRLNDLVSLEDRLAEAVDGDTLLHSDLRSDNIMLTADGIRMVDWAWAARGQPWIDQLIFCLCAAVQGADAPDSMFLASRWGRRADAAAVDSVLAALAGRFLLAAASDAPAPCGLRAFQREEARVSLEWLSSRTKWG
ncbi:phosphotransferase [Plantactinospora sp. S1510]|uniref:Phosphotransferase n=1 Tax=Plantactinospora alkalitolerans TaxID=2789879 RepID=A0ABS0H1A0_9ACTN|nr:phosphotransferase [Plantactinospora alkalitolerans]MBF9132220.1 phosphotransferase [Plantactinospora alkalitolerans]